MDAAGIIRRTASEFDGVDDSELADWIEITRPMVSRRRFGNLYEQALAYLVCHKMKMAGYGETPLGDAGLIGVGFAVGSVSEGGSTISFGANQSTNTAADAELGLTVYGVQYLQLRRSAVMPICSAGERRRL